MRVKLDLRPESVKNFTPPKIRKMGLFMFCMFLIFGIVVSCSWYSMAKDILFLRTEIKSFTNRIEGLNTVKAGLTAEIARLAKQEAVYASSLGIMQQELPAVEVLDAIDRSLIKGVTLTSLSLTQNDLKLNGVADIEDSIVESARELLGSGTFSAAQVPVVTRTDAGPEGLKFSLSLTPLNIGETGVRWTVTRE